MSKIDIKAILEKYSLDKVDTASALFPGNKYPSIALTRVINGEAYLNSEQMSKLSAMLGVTVDSLYTDKAWQASSKQPGVMKFERESYTAELDTATWITKVFLMDSILHESIIHSGAIPLSDYLAAIDEIIKKYD